MQSGNTVDFVPKTKKDLANEYGLSTGTIAKWCKQIDIVTCGTLTIPQVKKFYEHYDYPQKEVPIRFLTQKGNNTKL